jgi:hypothetical protein
MLWNPGKSLGRINIPSIRNIEEEIDANESA